jgi:hypothetical protein
MHIKECNQFAICEPGLKERRFSGSSLPSYYATTDRVSGVFAEETKKQT